jgi:hypothetical protein
MKMQNRKRRKLMMYSIIGLRKGIVQNAIEALIQYSASIITRPLTTGHSGWRTVRTERMRTMGMLPQTRNCWH